MQLLQSPYTGDILEVFAEADIKRLVAASSQREGAPSATAMTSTELSNAP